MPRFADSQIESRISGIERELSRKVDPHEIHTLRSDVASLEHTCGAPRSEVDGLRNELQTLQDQHRETQERLTRVMDKLEIWQ